MSLSTEYRGYTISYGENTDQWGCFDCGVTAPTLSAAKAKIDALHLKLRKESAFEGYEIMADEGREAMKVRAVPTKLIEYLGRKEQRHWSSGKIAFLGHRVASMAKRSANGRASRRETMLDYIAPITPEVHAAIAEANRLGAIAFAAKQEFHQAVDAIPRAQIEDIAGLVEASDHKFEEGEA
jgi:hypothetical protein